MRYPWLRRDGNTINFIAGPLIEEYGSYVVDGVKYMFDCHQEPNHIFVITTALLGFRNAPWPVRVRMQWLTKDALLLPWTGGHGEPEPFTQLPMGWDNHIYYVSTVPKAIDLLVIAKSPSEGVEISKRLMKTDPTIRAILDATRGEPQPLPEFEIPKKFPMLEDVKPIW